MFAALYICINTNALVVLLFEPNQNRSETVKKFLNINVGTVDKITTR